ncbi:PQQ-binding-like beta-propeller repeat protein [Bacteroides sp. An269]|uniref:outer membrane protein assembly factor BamB family protein n=1 Tax=Bacteroides sp. An269 TaxID=1965613 RepID=UPI000B382F6D|nr:PQQ-binding-like beta-propeller repeat protein [Bacteroides sp. An269]OUO84333.1 hypothetical protein B5F71_01985 [Bacteroides sp. An269]
MKKLIWMAAAFVLITACQDDDKVNTKPVAAFKATATTVEVEQSISFTNLSFDEDGQISRWQWDFGNGTTSEEENPTIFYNEPGDYKVVLTVWDNQGQQNANSFDKTIAVKEKSLSDEEPELIWEYTTTTGFQDASLAVDNQGNIIFGCDANNSRGDYNIAVLNNNGEEQWTYKAGDVVRSTPAVADDGTFYIGSYDDNLYAFKSESSTILGTYDTNDNVKYTSPAVDMDGTVYYGGDNQKLCALSAVSMSELWSADCGGDIQSPVVIGDDAVYVCNNSGKMLAFAKADGSKLWEIEYGASCTAAPALGEDGTIYMCGNTSDGGIVMAVNAADGIVKWQSPSVSKYDNSGIALDLSGRLYVGDSDGVMTCYSQSNGDMVWTFRSQGRIRCTPAITDNGNICFGDGAGYFYILNEEGKQVYKEVKLGNEICSSPAIGSDGTVYICVNVETNQQPGRLCAFRTTATGAMKGWSMRGGNSLRNGRRSN